MVDQRVVALGEHQVGDDDGVSIDVGLLEALTGERRLVGGLDSRPAARSAWIARSKWTVFYNTMADTTRLRPLAQ